MNEHEAHARAKKATKLLLVITNANNGVLPPRSMIEGMSEMDWGLAAALAQCAPPSERTKNLVADLAAYALFQASDPFADVEKFSESST